jgi:hypothetical protein
MTIDRRGGREATIAAFVFGVLFLCILGLLALSEVGDRSNKRSDVITVADGSNTGTYFVDLR